MTGFRAAEQSLGTVGADVLDQMLSAAADLALVLDDRGVIRDVSAGGSLKAHDLGQWIGSAWADTVARDSREKVHGFLEDVSGATERQINHILPDGGNLMVSYSVVALPVSEHRVAIGKDLSSLERLQQKLVNVQHQVERDYQRLRQFEERYHLLLRSAPDAVLVANRSDLQITDANDAASALCGATARRLTSMRLPQCFNDKDRASLEHALKTLGDNSGTARVELTARKSGEPLHVTLSVFASQRESQIMVRMAPTTAPSVTAESADDREGYLRALVDKVPDALVATDERGRVLIANAEFLDLAQLVSLDAIEGADLSRWLGFDAVDYRIIVGSLVEHGSLRMYNTRLRGEHGSMVEVEVSAVAMSSQDGQAHGYSIRNISQRVNAANGGGQGAPLVPSEDQLVQLVGRVPLKELVRESTDLIERLCIEVALDKTGNNRAAAAEILGLSRQSLYSKLSRHSIAS